MITDLSRQAWVMFRNASNLECMMVGMEGKGHIPSTSLEI